MEQLAKELNVSVIDLKALLNSVVIGIEQDKAKEAFLSADEATRTALCLAYVVHAGKKMNQFTMTYLTNPEAKKAFISNAYNLVTQGA